MRSTKRYGIVIRFAPVERSETARQWADSCAGAPGPALCLCRARAVRRRGARRAAAAGWAGGVDPDFWARLRVYILKIIIDT